MNYEFRLTGTSVVIPLMEIPAEEMEKLKRTHPLEGVPLYFARRRAGVTAVTLSSAQAAARPSGQQPGENTNGVT